LGVFIYNIFLILFRIGVHIASIFNNKAAKWVSGRKNLLDRLEKDLEGHQNIIWMHCASLGEFEQGRPLLEEIRNKWPEKKLLLTFFSPSGYEFRKKYEGVDWVFYLPMDGAATARKFLEITKPSLVIFVKYEFWYYYLKKIKYREIPLLLVSAHFRKDMSFFKWYGALQRKMLSRFDHIFVQNESSRQLLDEIGIKDIVTVSGDTRFDRVIGIAEKFTPLPKIEEFLQGQVCIIAGSTWPADEKSLVEALSPILAKQMRLIIAPHEINEQHLSEVEIVFPNSVRYSSYYAPTHTDARVMIIDNIGMLSRLYHYCTIAYIGGGFNKTGIHNILEAAVFGKPVLFGPNYNKYREAIELIEAKGAKSVENAEQLKVVISELMTNQQEYDRMSMFAREYVWVNKGATGSIINYIQEKRLLTS